MKSRATIKTESRHVLQMLRAYESRNVTFMEEDGSWPIVWDRARGTYVWDTDGRKYLDLTAAFGVAAAGHANPRVVSAGQKQMATLLHAMGDVHPHARKAQLARELSRITFERWTKRQRAKTIFCNSGFEAVEAALKTAVMATGKPGIIAFEGAYHGLGYGALNATHRELFRSPFREQLGEFGRFVPFPAVAAGFQPAVADVSCVGAPPQARAGFPEVSCRPRPSKRCSHANARQGTASLAARMAAATSAAGSQPAVRHNENPPRGLATTLEHAKRLLSEGTIGAVLVEPIQVRGGINIPPAHFLTRLRELCDAHGALLILDEIYTGFGRTGRWFACEHSGVMPDLVCLGKALTGGFPLSACVGHADLMDAAWPPSGGEAIHTSTFLGHPVGCAMALAQIQEIERRQLVPRSAQLGKHLLTSLERLGSRIPGVACAVRGLGLLAGVELTQPDGRPATQPALDAIKKMLHRGFVLLPEGEHSNVISFTPPLTISRRQLGSAVEALEVVLRQSSLSETI